MRNRNSNQRPDEEGITTVEGSGFVDLELFKQRPDEEGITTLKCSRTSERACIQTRDLMKKGLRPVVVVGLVHAVYSNQRPDEKDYDRFGELVMPRLDSNQRPDEEGITTSPGLGCGGSFTIQTRDLMKKGYDYSTGPNVRFCGYSNQRPDEEGITTRNIHASALR